MSNVPQTTYAQYFTEFVLGVPAFAAEVQRKISRIASGVIPYGRFVIQSRKNDAVCRLPRANKIVITNDGGTYTAGDLVTTIVHGSAVQYSGDTVASTTTVITTAFTVNKATTLTAHAAAILAAMADGFSCASAAEVITYTGDSSDIISSTTSVSGITGNMTIASEVISSADVATDVLGLSYLTHNRQQAITTGFTAYADKEPVNICRMGTIVCIAEEAVTPASTLYFRTVAKTGYYTGMAGDTTDSAKNLTLAAAKFVKTAAATALVPVEINLP